MITDSAKDQELQNIRAKKMNELTKNTPKVITEPVDLNLDNFDQFIQDHPIVIVDFWASWCGPCRAVAPVLKEIAKEYSGKVWIGKIDVDKNPDLAMRFRAMSIPTFWVFKNGKQIGNFMGAHPKNDKILVNLVEPPYVKCEIQKRGLLLYIGVPMGIFIGAVLGIALFIYVQSLMGG